MSRAFILLLFASMVSISTLAQSLRDRERVAYAYEQAGDWRNAARLWQELFQQNPTSSQYLVSALRCLKMLGNTEAMVSLIESAAPQARSPQAIAYYGYALYRVGKIDPAKRSWSDAQAQMATEADLRLLASLQVEAGARDAAVETYRYARKVLSNPRLFAEELAQIAIAAREVNAALDEILSLFEVTQNLSKTQGYIATLLAFDATRQPLLERIRKYAQANASNIAALRLYEWTLREIGDYTAALDIVVDIEQRTGKTGRELYAFAERARNEGAYDVASSAYQRLLSLAQQPDMRTMALFGYVQTLEQRTLERSVPDANALARIIAEYERIANQYPTYSVALDALLRIAELERDYGTDNPHRALTRFDTLLVRYPNSEHAARGRLERLPLLARLAGIDSAAAEFNREQPAIMRFSSLQAHALFVSAEFDFFRCRLTDALDKYHRIASNTESPFANDAIERATFITINRNDSAALCRAAAAEAAFYQQDLKRGFATIDEIVTVDSESDLAEYMFMRAGSVALSRANYDAAIKYFGQLFEKFPETIYGDRALWSLALAHRAKGDTQTALAYATTLLERYGNSIYVPRARVLVRTLRGDS
ncbi:MAG: tetratricopeptide repeat protein [Chlorobi bacterium]|nr:tetratricopeptide repeat protein [Chlorobiota bacterium]